MEKLIESYSGELVQMVSAETMDAINYWIKKYPKDQKQSAVLSTLRLVQEEHGFLTTELMNAVAAYLEMPKIAVYEVATFYTMFETKPVGRHIINVCTNVSCKLRGANEIVRYLENKLNVKCGETTADNKYTLRSVECLCACIGAPMMQLDKDYHEYLTPELIDQILENI